MIIVIARPLMIPSYRFISSMVSLLVSFSTE